MNANLSARLSKALCASTLALLFSVVLINTGCKSKPVDDATLTTNVQQKIASDAALQNEAIQAVVNGGVATLSGQVSNEAARTLASNDAAAVKDVKQVVNNLIVAPLAASPAMTPPPVAPEPTPAPKEKKITAKEKPVPAPAPIVRQPAPAPAPAPAPVASTPAPPPAPRFRDVTINAGTSLPVRLTQTLDSGTAQVGDSFSGVLASDIVQDGVVALRRGTAVTGRVVDAKDATHFKGSSYLSVQLVGLNARGNRMQIATDAVSKEGKGRGTNTAKKAGIGAVGGAILGGILGGGKGAAIGAGVGGAGGAGINAVTKGEQVQFPSESILRFRLEQPITVRVSNDQ